jgi:hypothetical protein
VPAPVQESSSTRVQKVLNEAEEEVSAIKRALGLDTNSIADVTANKVQIGKSREQPDAKLAEKPVASVEADNPEKLSPVGVSVEEKQDVAKSSILGKEEKVAAQGCCCCVM